jgi:hypothetical protein
MCNDGAPSRPQYELIHFWWTPTLPVAVFSPVTAVERHNNQFVGYATSLDHATNTGMVTLHSNHGNSHDVHLSGIKKRLLLHTTPLIPTALQYSVDDMTSADRITHLLSWAMEVL